MVGSMKIVRHCHYTNTSCNYILRYWEPTGSNPTV